MKKYSKQDGIEDLPPRHAPTPELLAREREREKELKRFSAEPGAGVTTLRYGTSLSAIDRGSALLVSYRIEGSRIIPVQRLASFRRTPKKQYVTAAAYDGSFRLCSLCT